MTRSNHLVALAILCVGGAVGHVIKKSFVSSSSPSPENLSPNSDLPSPKSPTASATLNLDGTLKLSDLIAYPPGPYRMAEVVMWLPQATPDELRQFWQHLTTTTPRDYQLLPLIMGRWMKLAPEDALAVTAGTEFEAMPWTAWGKINPELAVQEAKRRKSGYLSRVLEAAALTQPEFVRRLLDENPAMFGFDVRMMLAKGLESDSWQSALQFRFHPQKLEDWARDEPEKAWEWAMQNSSKVRVRYGSENPWAGVVGPMLEADPAALDAAIAKLPDGRVKGDIIAAKASRLADTDPTAALAMLDATEAGAPRQRLLEAIGPALFKSDPARSLQLFRELAGAGAEETMQLLPDKEQKNDRDWLGYRYDDWIAPLLKQDPAAAMKGLPETVTNEIVDKWENYDSQGYRAWLATQPAGYWKDHRCREVASTLASGNGGASQGDYPAAFEWLSHISNQDSRDSAAQQLVGDWLKQNPQQAAAYFDRDDALLKPTYEKLTQAAAQ